MLEGNNYYKPEYHTAYGDCWWWMGYADWHTGWPCPMGSP